MNITKVKLNVGTHHRPLSWSCIAAFEYDRVAWYRKYVLNEKQEENEAMKFGKYIGEKLASDPTFLPDVPRYKHFEKKLEGKIDDIILLGYLDSFDPEGKHILEYKTSGNKKKWTKKSVIEHGQIDFYYLLVWLNYQIPPEQVNCHLVYIPVEEGNDFKMKLSKDPIQVFESNRTTMDVLKFGAYIRQVYNEMVKYVEEHD